MYMYNLFYYEKDELFEQGLFQIWRLITAKLAFLDLKDLFLCSVLLYYFRIFERRFGSRKFVVSFKKAHTCSVFTPNMWQRCLSKQYIDSNETAPRDLY